MNNIQAKQFESRKELDEYISENFGLTTELKDVFIEGKGSELKKLRLDSITTVWGIRCKQTDKENKKIKKVNRGEFHYFGINGDKQDSKKIK